MRRLMMVCALLPFTAHAAGELTANERATVCGQRSSCKVAAVHPAAHGLRVAELHFALSDRPSDSMEEGCRMPDGEQGGGVEYWKLSANAVPERVLSLCNDGYGASGVGSDEVTVDADSLRHAQYGGSAWRWLQDITYDLSSWTPRLINTCSYHNMTPGSGEGLELNLEQGQMRSAIFSKVDANDDAVGCPDPETAAYRGQNLPKIDLTLDSMPVLASCALTLRPDGQHGQVVFGSPDRQSPVEARAVALGSDGLLLQVYDPTTPAAKPKSWVGLPHWEVWLSADSDPFRALADPKAVQIGITLDGQVYNGVGKSVLPKVTRSSAKDAQGRSVVLLRLQWSEPVLDYGAAIVYSEADSQGKQLRLTANTSIERNRPHYLPKVVGASDTGLSGELCQLRAGQLVWQPQLKRGE